MARKKLSSIESRSIRGRGRRRSACWRAVGRSSLPMISCCWVPIVAGSDSARKLCGELGLYRGSLNFKQLMDTSPLAAIDCQEQWQTFGALLTNSPARKRTQALALALAPPVMLVCPSCLDSHANLCPSRAMGRIRCVPTSCRDARLKPTHPAALPPTLDNAGRRNGSAEPRHAEQRSHQTQTQFRPACPLQRAGFASGRPAVVNLRCCCSAVERGYRDQTRGSCNADDFSGCYISVAVFHLSNYYSFLLHPIVTVF